MIIKNDSTFIKNNSISKGDRVTVELCNGFISNILINDISKSKDVSIEGKVIFIENLDDIKTIEIKTLNFNHSKIYNSKKEIKVSKIKKIDYLCNLSFLISIISLFISLVIVSNKAI